MRGSSFPLMAWLSKSEGALLRRFCAGGGCGFFACLYIIGVALYGASSFSPDISYTIDNSGLWGAFLATLTQAFLAVCLVASINTLLLCIIAWSKALRGIVRNVSRILADVPVLGGGSLLLLVLPAFWTVVGVAVFSLSMRTLHVILSVENEIPSSYQKTARSLRMGMWHRFWQIHIPLSFPKCIQTIMGDMPDFWVRLLGAQALVTLMHPRIVVGCGGQAINFWHRNMTGEFFLTLGAMAAIGVLAHHSFIRPLLRRTQRYDICRFSTILPPSFGEEGSLLWKKPIFSVCLSGGVIVSFVSIIYDTPLWLPSIYEGIIFSIVCVFSLIACITIWAIVGVLLIGEKTQSQYTILSVMGLFLIPPCVFLTPFVSSYSLFLLLLIISLQSIFSWRMLSDMGGKQQKHLYKTARHLRLPIHSLLWNVKFPLVFPALSSAGETVLFSLWNIVFLAGALSPLSFMTIERESQGWNIAASTTFLLVITAFSLATRHGFIRPLQRFLVRKYKVFS